MNAAHIKAGRTPRTQTLFGCVIRVVLISLAVYFALSLLGTLIAYGQSDPLGTMPPLAVAAMLLSFLFGGWLAAKMRGKQFLIAGLLTGLFMAAPLLLLMLALCGELSPDGGRLLLSYPPAIALSAIGGVLGGVQPKRKLRRRR